MGHKWISLLIIANFLGLSHLLQLPKHFLVGFSSSSYQSEGAWNEDGKGVNYFDVLTHTRPWGKSNTNGDVAVDSYHKYKEDVAILKNLNAQVYRFSLSWSRILPTGKTDVINKRGIDFYNNLINELIANGITPMVTIHHWDLPIAFVKIGGWANSQVIDHFVNFARIAFDNFGDRVTWWMTFNEPASFCVNFHTQHSHTYAIPNDNGEYLCMHNILIAHAKTYHLYHTQFSPYQNGFISMAMDVPWFESKTNSTRDREAAETALQFWIGWCAHPIYIGDYPPAMRERVNALSQLERRGISRLPYFDNEMIEFIKGTADYMAINFYITALISAAPLTNHTHPSWETDQGNTLSFHESWPDTAIPLMKVVPWGIRKVLNWIKNEYGNPSVIITENGYAGRGEKQDFARIDYHKEYMRNVVKAVKEDGCDVFGYIMWSLMDYWEWSNGLKVKFGVYHVDYNTPNRTRTPKESAKFIKGMLATRTIPE